MRHSGQGCGRSCSWQRAPRLPAVAQPAKVSIGYDNGLPGACLLLKDKGFFEKRGIDAMLTRTADCNQRAAPGSNSLQIGMTTATILLQAADGGSIVASLAAPPDGQGQPDHQPDGAQGGEDRETGDLKGKKVGVAGINSVTDVFFREMARQWQKWT